MFYNANIDYAIYSIANDFETHSQEALVDPESHLANPVNAYLLIKRFTVDWRQLVDKYLSASRTQGENIYIIYINYYFCKNQLICSVWHCIMEQE